MIMYAGFDLFGSSIYCAIYAHARLDFTFQDGCDQEKYDSFEGILFDTSDLSLSVVSFWYSERLKGKDYLDLQYFSHLGVYMSSSFHLGVCFV